MVDENQELKIKKTCMICSCHVYVQEETYCQVCYKYLQGPSEIRARGMEALRHSPLKTSGVGKPHLTCMLIQPIWFSFVFIYLGLGCQTDQIEYITRTLSLQVTNLQRLGEIYYEQSNHLDPD